MKLELWKINNDFEIQYHFHLSKVKSEFMLVSFPGGGGNTYDEFGYVFTIQKFNLNALFIKSDPKTNKSRLTCYQKEFIFEDSIVELIKKCGEASNSTKILVVGSSMGGYCSLYYGLKYNFDIVSGSPPYKFNDIESFRFATGSEGSSARDWLNSLLPNVIHDARNKYNKRIFVSFGEGEGNWTKNGGQELIEELKAANLDLTYEIYPFSNHNTIHRLFPNILADQIASFLQRISSTGNSERDYKKTTKRFDYLTQLQIIYNRIIELINGYNLSIVNTEIVNCKHKGKTNEYYGLKNYVYLKEGWYWNTRSKVPTDMIAAENFWVICDVKECLSFRFQDAILYSYKKFNRLPMLEWCMENAREYLTYIQSVADKRKKNDIGNTISRIHFFINLHVTATNNSVSLPWFPLLSRTILRDIKAVLSAPLILDNFEIQYQIVLVLLHIGVYLRKDVDFYNDLGANTIELLNVLNNFFIGEDGFCIAGQITEQDRLTNLVNDIYNFIKDNDMSTFSGVNQFKQKYNKIIKCSSHISRPNGVLVNIGHSDSIKNTISSFVERNPRNLILKDSNIAFLEDDLSYITINGGQNIRAKIRHNDLLSFTWFYDNIQIFTDTGGGKGELLDYSLSAAAHNAFICENTEYTTPSYIDFTTIDNFTEHNDSVFIAMSNTLLNNLVLRRNFLWIKPNIIFLYDEAISDEKQTVSQNFILPYYQCDLKDANNITINIDENHLCTVRQFFTQNLTLNKFTGTTDVKDTDNYRGSIITQWTKLKKGLNLVYSATARNTKFITIIELHSNKSSERHVDAIDYSDNEYFIKLHDGEIINYSNFINDTL